MVGGGKYKYLPFDTKHFDATIKYQILSLFDNLDDLCDGVLIKSENYQALNTILLKYEEKIDLIYIDPPFNTGSDFDYLDNYQDSTWCSIMHDRLWLSKSIMSNKGSIYVHLDTDANYYNRILMNDVFNKDMFVNEIVWCYQWGGIARDKFAEKHQTIYWYSKPLKIFNADKCREAYITTDTRWHNNEEGKLLRDIWDDIPIINTMSTERYDYDTQKPEQLLQRIVNASSNINSIVCDFFVGSGTTVAVAHKLHRKWLGIEMGYVFNTMYIDDGENKIGNIGRMKLVLFGYKVGISKNQEVQVGGMFKYYELEQYEDVLDKAIYTTTTDNVANLSYDFSNNEKLAHDGLTIDYSNESNPICYAFEKLYPDVDIWETISNFCGFKIKKYHSSDEVTYIDRSGKEITLHKQDITFEKYPQLKQLIWW
jgi:adenine-specific DNA-methyltransferase